MTIRIAINGYGRIGRNIVRALYESKKFNHGEQKIKLVAINDLGDTQFNAHLTQYDSVHGRFPGTIETKDNYLIINGDKILTCREREPSKLPWKDLNIDVVLECTGLFTSRDKAEQHIQAGAKKVIISAPAADVDATIVYGVNDNVLNAQSTIISNASCTTNCLAPVAKILNDHIGIEQGSMTTIHAFTNDQSLHDVYHTDPYRARAAGVSMIPTQTGAAKAVGLVLPELAGKLDGMAVRVPTANVSLIDLTIVTTRRTSVEEINTIMKKAANGSLKGILDYNDKPLVSVDFNHQPASSTFDATQTKVAGSMVKVMAWYDNEWGFSNRMLDSVVALVSASAPVVNKTKQSTARASTKKLKSELNAAA